MTSPSRTSAHLSELFSSVQGEGLRVGERHLFVRFYGCHLDCAFCDTPETLTRRHPGGFLPSTFRIEETPGGRDFRLHDNPVTVPELLGLLERFGLAGHDAVSFTGGEPLLHGPFLEALLPALGPPDRSTPNRSVPPEDAARGRAVRYLETAGDLPRALEPLLPHLEVVSMDLKLPSVTGGRPRWDEHRRFLELCAGAGGLETTAKVVLAEGTDPADLERAIALLAEVDPSIPLILQPASPVPDAVPSPTGKALTPPAPPPRPPDPAQVLAWQARARKDLETVRVIPQTHKMLGQL